MIGHQKRRTQTTLHAAKQSLQQLPEALPKLLVLNLLHQEKSEEVIQNLREGLLDTKHRWISPSFLYDKIGSELYEAITNLPEYYQTRTEKQLLEDSAQKLAEQYGHSEMIELGSGSSSKTRQLLNAWQKADKPLTYVPVDISQTMLEASARKLVEEYPDLHVLGIASRYEEAFQAITAAPDRLFLFLGGTIGNFPPSSQTAFFQALSARMATGNHLLVGFDRAPHAEKPVDVILQAYNDAQGVTARFNLNLLTRLNRDFGGDFNPSQWRHQAIFNEAQQQIEMYLFSQVDQTVTLKAADLELDFKAGEGLLTEISRRFDPDTLAAWFQRTCQMTGIARWDDPKHYYSLMMLEKQ